MKCQTCKKEINYKEGLYIEGNSICCLKCKLGAFRRYKKRINNFDWIVIGSMFAIIVGLCIHFATLG